MRRERYFPGPAERWTLRHRHWLSQQQFDDPPSRITYADYLHAQDVLLARRDHVGRQLEQLAPQCMWAEIGDWKRFAHPDALAAYVGLVPAEHSSGRSPRLGKITKAGSTHARRLLVEAALHPPPDTGGRRQTRRPPARPGPGADRPRLARAAAPERPLEPAARGARQAGRRRDDRDRARTRRRLREIATA